MRLRTGWLAALAVVLSWTPAPPSAAADSRAMVLTPPVDASVAGRYDPPPERWAAGHRGIDYVVAHGTAVRAAGPGTVTFAGNVAGIMAVAIRHRGGIETTYTSLSQVLVRAGDEVAEGRWVGRSGEAHPGAPGLHFGVKLNGAYVDPLLYLGAVDISKAVHLAPLLEPGALPAASYRRDCRPAASPGAKPPAPNDNVAVAVAGIGSATVNGADGNALFRHGPEALGYPSERIFRFSYRGDAAADLHEPYSRTDTYGDLHRAARRLKDLLEDIAARYPGADVDLFAHSQGGIVSRVFLETLAGAWDPRLPHIDHFVTYSSPHTGAPLASNVDTLERRTLSGRLWLGLGSLTSRVGAPWPEPRAVSVRQLAPDSAVMDALATEDVAYGTRTLALAIPNDVVVPANHALYPGKYSRVVPPRGISGHDEVIRSPDSQAIAYAFLRDAAETCAGGWDRWGPRAGGVLSFAERNLGTALRIAEKAAFGPAGFSLPW